MQFCDECNNLMDPVEDRESLKLMYICKNCTVDPVYTDETVVYTNDLREAEEERQVSWKDIPYDPTLQRADGVCPICEHRQVVLYEVQYAETITLYFVCANVTCAHHWTNRDIQANAEQAAEVEPEDDIIGQEATQIDQYPQEATQLDQEKMEQETQLDDLF